MSPCLSVSLSDSSYFSDLCQVSLRPGLGLSVPTSSDTRSPKYFVLLNKKTDWKLGEFYNDQTSMSLYSLFTKVYRSGHSQISVLVNASCPASSPGSSDALTARSWSGLGHVERQSQSGTRIPCPNYLSLHTLTNILYRTLQPHFTFSRLNENSSCSTSSLLPNYIEPNGRGRSL